MIKNWKLFTESKKYQMVDGSEIPFDQFIEIDQKSQQTVIQFFVDRNFDLKSSSVPCVDISSDKSKIQAEWNSESKTNSWSCRWGQYNNIIVIAMIDDEWYYVRHIKNYGVDDLVKCDQLDGLMEYLSDTVPFSLKINESNTDSLVVPITKEVYDDWVANRYVGLPNEKAKWAMIDSIKLFEESLAHQSRKLSGKYVDEYMSKTYITSHFEKMAWEYQRRKSSVSDFIFTMFEGDDYCFIIRLYINYHYYFYKVDDIVGIESLYDAIYDAIKK